MALRYHSFKQSFQSIINMNKVIFDPTQKFLNNNLNNKYIFNHDTQIKLVQLTST